MKNLTINKNRAEIVKNLTIQKLPELAINVNKKNSQNAQIAIDKIARRAYNHNYRKPLGIDLIWKGMVKKMKNCVTVEELFQQLEVMMKLGHGADKVWYRDEDSMDNPVEQGIWDTSEGFVVLG